MSIRWTITEHRIAEMLSDGYPHLPADLMVCIADDLADKHALELHISNMRKKLNPIGEDIVCRFNHKRIYYQHVRLLTKTIE
jgi:hypothetical protein